MKLHAVGLLASALIFGGCAESVEDIQVVDPAADSGSSTTDSSSGKDSSTTPVDTGAYDPDTGSTEDTEPEDTGSVEDSGEFPDFGGGEDSGSVDDGGGAADSGVSFGFGYCSSASDCPGGCCSEGTCGVAVFGACVTF